MKSTNSLNNFFNKFFSFNLLKNNVKRFWVLSLAYFIFLFIMYPFVFLVNKSSGYINNIGRYNIFQEALHLGGFGIFSVFLTIIVTFVLGLWINSFMHKKDEMIFTQSLPLTKFQLFNTSFLSVLFLTVLPLTLVTGIIAIEKTALGFTAIRLLDVLRYYLSTLLIIGVVYTVTAFCCSFSGTTIFSGLLTIFISLFPLIVCAVIEGTIALFAVGGSFNELLLDKVLNYTPLIKFFSLSMREFTYFSGSMYLLMGIVFYVLGYISYKYRKNERTTETLVYNKSKVVIKYLITALAVLPFALSFGLIGGYKMSITILGALFGVFFTYFVMEMIIEKSFFIWHKYKGYLISTAACILVILIIAFDAFGYSRYIPKLENVEAVYVGTDYYEMDYKYLIEENALLLTDEQNTRILSNEFCYDEETIKLAMELNKKLSKVAISNYRSLYIDSHESNEFGNKYYISRQFAYKLKNGKVVHRTFTFNVFDCEEELLALLNNKEYKKSLYADFYDLEIEKNPDLFRFVQLSNEITGYGGGTEGTLGYELSFALLDDFINTDMDIVDFMASESFGGASWFHFIDESIYNRYEQKYANKHIDNYEINILNVSTRSIELPKVIAKYEKTTKLLKQNGLYDLLVPTNKSVNAYLLKLPVSDVCDDVMYNPAVFESTLLTKEPEVNDYTYEGLSGKIYEGIKLSDEELSQVGSMIYGYGAFAGGTECDDKDYLYYLFVKPTDYMIERSNYDTDVYVNEFGETFSVFKQGIPKDVDVKLDNINGFTDMIEAN